MADFSFIKVMINYLIQIINTLLLLLNENAETIALLA
jgi:hypothetical protein